MDHFGKTLGARSCKGLTIEQGDTSEEAVIEQDALRWHGLFNARDDLEEPHRGLFVVHKVYGYSVRYLATKLGWPPSLVLSRIWRASAELQKKLGQDAEGGVVIASDALVIPPVMRAVFCTIWSVENRLPTFHGITAHADE